MGPVIVLWLVLGLGLLFFELHHLAFYALFAAVGAFAAGVVALVAPDALIAQTGVWVGVSALGVALVRPMVSGAYERRHHAEHVAKGVHGGIVGQEAVTLDEVSDVRAIGHVRLAGERWLAVAGSAHPIAPHTRVVITAVQGTTLTVWPTDEDDNRALLQGPDGSES